MKTEYVFEICHGRYRGMRAYLAGKIAAVDLDTPSGGDRWRPERARAAEYVADFELAGERVLRRPEWKGRLRLFKIYFCRCLEYRRAMVLVGVPEGMFSLLLEATNRTSGTRALSHWAVSSVAVFSKRRLAAAETGERRVCQYSGPRLPPNGRRGASWRVEE